MPKLFCCAATGPIVSVPGRRPSALRPPALLLIAIFAVAGLLAASAQAAPSPVRANPHGKFLGVVGHSRPRAAAPAGATAGGNLAYNGGPVMHSDANYAIFWEPAGYTTTSSYKNTIGNYFARVAADSGKTTNVYATNTEYYDTTGGVKSYIPYTATYAATLVDAQPYPASGCPPQGGAGPCLTDAQIASEVNRLVTANHWPRGLGSVYYVFFPPSVGSCFDSTTSSCSFSSFCAYHSSLRNSSGDVLYADMPYAAVAGCDPGQRPNGDPADATLNVLSHENNETITDPLGTAWYDAQGNENGDKCAWIFGSSAGGLSGTYFNQLIGSGTYWLQEEWSNTAGGCLQSASAAPPTDEAPTAAFASTPASPTAGTPVAFAGSASADPDGSITAYGWSFGDGATATGASPSHTYTAAGTYTVTVQVTDSAGLTGSISKSITVSAVPSTDENPTAAFTFGRYYASSYVRFNGSGADSDGSIHSYSWNFGDGSATGGSSVLHRFPASGTYTVTLTVHDSSGLTATATHTVKSP